jgi:hypothetical protein
LHPPCEPGWPAIWCWPSSLTPPAGRRGPDARGGRRNTELSAAGQLGAKQVRWPSRPFIRGSRPGPTRNPQICG